MSENKMYALMVTLPQWKRVMDERETPATTVDKTIERLFSELDHLRLEIVRQAERDIIEERLDNL